MPQDAKSQVCRLRLCREISRSCSTRERHSKQVAFIASLFEVAVYAAQEIRMSRPRHALRFCATQPVRVCAFLLLERSRSQKTRPCWRRARAWNAAPDGLETRQRCRSRYHHPALPKPPHHPPVPTEALPGWRARALPCCAWPLARCGRVPA